jgi:hypothetical protein
MDIRRELLAEKGVAEGSEEAKGLWARHVKGLQVKALMRKGHSVCEALGVLRMRDRNAKKREILRKYLERNNTRNNPYSYGPPLDIRTLGIPLPLKPAATK